MTVDTTIVVAVLGVVSAGIGLVYRDLRRDRDDWKEMAFGLRDVNRQAIEVTKKATRG